MKVGVSFSGSDSTALNAHLYMDALTRYSLPVESVSCCAYTSVPLLLWAYGLLPEELEELLQAFAAARSPQDGVRLLERMGIFQRQPKHNLAISCVDAGTGITVIFADFLCADAWNLKVRPLKGQEAHALLATLSPYDGDETFALDEMQLCDFSLRYGCPFFPLKMSGAERLLSFTFTGGHTPAQIAADSLNALTGHHSDLSYSITPDTKDIQAFFTQEIDTIYQKLLF